MPHGPHSCQNTTHFILSAPDLLFLFLACDRIMAKENRVVALRLVYFTLLMVTLPVGTFFLFHDFLLLGKLGVFKNACMLLNHHLNSYVPRG